MQAADDFLCVDLYAKDFSQGNIVYIELYRKADAADRSLSVKRVFYGKREVLLSERSWGYRGFFAIHPETAPGKKTITIEYKRGWSGRSLSANLKIKRTAFQYKRRPLDLGKYSDVDYQAKPGNIQFIKESSKKKREAFSRTGDDMITGAFSHPRDLHYVTSPFWAKRTVMRYRFRNGKKVRLKNRIKVHRGLDLRGSEGTPVFAIADGRVALAEELFYEGNMLIIDHGNRVFSYYMHLHGLNVKKGDRVRAGDLAGYVGTTGVSTAAHLHVSLMVRGVQVDPLSILPLPIRD